MRQPLSGSFARSISTTTTRSPAAARSSTITAFPVETLRSSARVEQRPSLRSASTARISEDRYSTKAAPAIQPTVHNIFENTTGSWQYVVADPETLTAVIIDPVLEFEPVTQTVGTRTADKLLELVKKHGYKVERILETHAHADHMTAASYLQRRLASDQGHKPSICIGSRIDQVQKRFSSRYHVPKDEYATVFDTLLEDEEEFSIGNIKAKAIHIPGHTPDHMGYKIGDNVFTGDLIFHKDLGTARADFPGGSAEQIFKSAQKILALPGHTRVWSGHDYPPEGREAMSSMTVQEHREQNKHLMDGTSEEEFVKMRNTRDAALAAPKLLHQSLQVNIRGGNLPKPDEDGQRTLHLPLKLDKLSW